jgi:hypothetical protein
METKITAFPLLPAEKSEDTLGRIVLSGFISPSSNDD